MLNYPERYNKLYANSEDSFYGKPNPIIKNIPEHISNGKALDLGAGDVRHSIYLAQKGFEVTAVDTSEVGLQKIEEVASVENLKIKCILADLNNWNITKNYDLIVASVILQHLKLEKNKKNYAIQKSSTTTHITFLNSITNLVASKI